MVPTSYSDPDSRATVQVLTDLASSSACSSFVNTVNTSIMTRYGSVCFDLPTTTSTSTIRCPEGPMITIVEHPMPRYHLSHRESGLCCEQATTRVAVSRPLSLPFLSTAGRTTDDETKQKEGRTTTLLCALSRIAHTITSLLLISQC